MNDANSVVITGMGLVTPLGCDIASNWDALCAARSGISSPDTFEFGSNAARALGLVHGTSALLDPIFPPQKQRKTERFMHLAVLAAMQAMRDAGCDTNYPLDRSRMGVYLGVGVGGLDAMCEGISGFKRGGPRSVSPLLIPRTISSEAAAWLSIEWDLQGPMGTVCNACSSSADAIGIAWHLIQSGAVDIMLAGGTESCVTPVAFAGFANMRAVSSWEGDPSAACRPFAKDRSGFVMAEGSGMLVLERESHARARGAQIYARLVGYGASSDAHHITAMHPDGRGAEQAVRRALRVAHLSPDAIDYVNAHGTSTAINDPVETAVIKRVFGVRAHRDTQGHLLVSSTKSMTGHMLGAAGAVELVYSALAIQHQVVPPTINLHAPDEQCDLDYVAHEARSADISHVMSNSFGFGGSNSVLILERV